MKIIYENNGDVQIINRDPDDYIPVRLTDGDEWIENLIKVIGGGGGGSVPTFQDQNGKFKRALVDDDRHVQIDIVDEGDLVLKATTPIIYNVTMTNTNTEYSQALPHQGGV